MQLCNENIESVYVMPGLLKFEHDCLTILRRSLIAVAPEEGCALLLGTKEKTSYWVKKPTWHVRKIWPCENIWHPGIFNFSEQDYDQPEQDSEKFSRENRFALDPKEQLEAQRWARENHLQVLGVAHSHPQGDPRPSASDLRWGISPGLMVIVSCSEEVKAWWQLSRASMEHREVQLVLDE